MPLRAWSRRTIGLLWVAGLLLETSLVIAGVVQSRKDSAQADADWEQTHGPIVAKGAPATSQGLRALDSAGVKLEMRGDTVTRVTLSPEAQREFRSMGDGVGQLIQGMAPAFERVFFLMAAVYLAIPAMLVGLTLAWVLARRRELGHTAA